MATPRADSRLRQLVELVLELAQGRLAARLEPSPVSDDIAAVITGIHILAEELGALRESSRPGSPNAPSSWLRLTGSSNTGYSTTRSISWRS